MEKAGTQTESREDGMSTSTDISTTETSEGETPVSTDRTLKSETSECETPVSTDRTLQSETSECETPVSTDRTLQSETCEDVTPVSTDRTLQSETSECETPVSTDRTLQSEKSEVETPVSTDRTLQSETGEVETPISTDITTKRERSDGETPVSTDRTLSESVEENYLQPNSREETTPIATEMSPDKTDSRQRLGFTPPLERPKDATEDSLGIIQELRKDGFLCHTPLIPRNTRQTRSGISFEYYFGAGRPTPRVLPRLKSDGNLGKTLGQRGDTRRRESPIKKNSFKRKSACKTFRWHTGCRVVMETRRVQRDQAEKRRVQVKSKDEWIVTGQYWQAVRQKQEKERKEDEQRRARERKILHGLMGRNFKDAFL